MSISSSTRKAGPYVGTGITTAFPFSFKVFQASEVVVIRTDLTGAETTLTLTTDYTISLNANQDANPGGTINMLTAPPSGYLLTATSWLQDLQPVTLTNMGGFYPKVINDALDRVTILIQQLSEKVSRAVKNAISAPAGINPTLPAPVPYQLISWNGSGTGFQNTDPTYSTALASDLASSSSGKGGALVGFLQSGSGATARNVADKLREIISVKDFGAVGNGLVDDTAAIQAALTAASTSGGRGFTLKFPAGTYNISSPLVLMPNTLSAALSGSDLHFSDLISVNLIGEGNAKIVAAATMPRMLYLVYNSSTSAIGPYYTKVEGLTFDGANLATVAIESDYTMHLSILKNKIRQVTNGIKFTGYGVAKILHNVIKANTCINFASGGGDSLIEANDFYPLTSGRGVNIAKLGSDTTIRDNVFNGEGNAGCIGVYLDGAVNTPADLIINVRVLNNEFSGMFNAVYGGRHASGRNIYGIRVIGNHTIPAAGGAVHTGNLVNFNGVDDCIVRDNLINSPSLPVALTATPGIQLLDCKRPLVMDNKIGNLLGPALYLRTVLNGIFSGNEITDVGQNGVSGVCVDIDTGCTYNRFFSNTVVRTNVAYAQEPFYERSGADFNEFERNRINGANRITVVGSGSVITGRIVAQGAYSLIGSTASLRTGSSGFTVNCTAIGVCTVTLTGPRISDTNYRVNITSDAAQTAVDTYTANTFVVRTYNSAGTASDALITNIEVVE